MNCNMKKISRFCLASITLLLVNGIKVNAETLFGNEAVAGISVTLDNQKEIVSTKKKEKVKTLSVEEENEKIIKGYNNLGISNVDDYLNIRKGPSETEKIIGKLPKYAGCDIIGIDENGWAEIQSGKVNGYVMSTYLVMGDDAYEMGKEVGRKVATVNTTTLKVREEATTESITLALVPITEELIVQKELEEWVKIKQEGDVGYVSKEFVDISFELEKAITFEEVVSGQNGVSDIRANMVSFAMQYLGRPYVWGGTSLTNGADCSGFTQAIYRNFGYSINRVSRDQANNGVAISASEARPGDLVFYNSGGPINHVAMYIGNGQIIHASSPETGIKISNMYYKAPCKLVRIINE